MPFKKFPTIIPSTDDDDNHGDEFTPLTPTSRRYKKSTSSAPKKSSPLKTFDFTKQTIEKDNVGGIGELQEAVRGL